ncbi:hypothetical protein UG54_01635 [Gordonia sihwensis]|nr:hypothetical protein UG54_01635 [Gordonia sihwensis]
MFGVQGFVFAFAVRGWQCLSQRAVWLDVVVADDRSQFCAARLWVSGERKLPHRTVSWPVCPVPCITCGGGGSLLDDVGGPETCHEGRAAQVPAVCESVEPLSALDEGEGMELLALPLDNRGV